MLHPEVLEGCALRAQYVILSDAPERVLSLSKGLREAESKDLGLGPRPEAEHAESTPPVTQRDPQAKPGGL